MHGRLKVKDSAEKAAEKAKEREKKRQKYLAGINALFDKRKKQEHSAKVLQVSGLLLQANPDALTIWNCRRETLLKLREKYEEEKSKIEPSAEVNDASENTAKEVKCYVVNDDSPLPAPESLPKEWQELFSYELNLVQSCLERNPKSYGAWHHRVWVVKELSNGYSEEESKALYDKELKLCNLYLKLDERNFHCWDYRRIIVKSCGIPVEKEVRYSLELINKNFSNFSAWHYRSKLLPLISPPDGVHPVSDKVFDKELRRIVDAIFTDPTDQSPWFFLRWLLQHPKQSPKLLLSGVNKISAENVIIVCSYSSVTISQSLPQVYALDEKENILPLTNIEWFNPHNHKSAQVWTAIIPISSNFDQLKLVSSDLEEVLLKLECSSTKILLPKALQIDLTSESLKTLKELLENCSELNEADPDKKWVLLTLVELLWTINSDEGRDEAQKILNQLCTIDPLRTGYYNDYKTRMIVKEKVRRYLEDGSFSSSVDLSGLGLYKLSYSEYLSGVNELNVSSNNMRNITAISNCVLCSKLILDGNPITDITDLVTLNSLKVLSLNKCNLKSLEVLLPLLKISTLEQLSLTDNLFEDDCKDKIKQKFSHLKKLNL